MDLTPKLVENGFAFISFLVIVVTFVWKVIAILDKRMGDIVVEIRHLVDRQRSDSDRLMDFLTEHDKRSGERHTNLIQLMEKHLHSLAEHRTALMKLLKD